ncbi:MAG TPA: iron-sulfur cluster assembly protein [Thermodesulfobacteriota bacterium]|nr:iron-sulfur cluster assembly protein [Thermodesulfobacteriota bacterium]
MGFKKVIGIQKEETPGAGDKGVTMTKFDKQDSAKSDDALTEEMVYDALQNVYDPEIPVSIVDLGLIYDVKITPGNNVGIKMSLTTPGCGMGAMIAGQAEDAVREIGANNVLIEVVWDPPWNPDMMSDAAKEKLGIA